MADDVLQDHDGVVHHDADHERQAQQREGVLREPEEVKHDEGAQNGRGDGQNDVEGRAPGTQEQPADEGRQDRGEEEVEIQLVGRVLHENRAVVVDGENHPAGRFF